MTRDIKFQQRNRSDFQFHILIQGSKNFLPYQWIFLGLKTIVMCHWLGAEELYPN